MRWEIFTDSKSDYLSEYSSSQFSLVSSVSENGRKR